MSRSRVTPTPPNNPLSTPDEELHHSSPEEVTDRVEKDEILPGDTPLGDSQNLPPQDHDVEGAVPPETIGEH